MTTPRAKQFPWNLDLCNRCDQCGLSRSSGNHTKCSRARKADYDQRTTEPGAPIPKPCSVKPNVPAKAINLIKYKGN